MKEKCFDGEGCMIGVYLVSGGEWNIYFENDQPIPDEWMTYKFNYCPGCGRDLKKGDKDGRPVTDQ